jgi:hypothetical protein
MSITLTSAEQTKVTNLWGATYLKRASNPETASPSAINWTAVDTAVEATIADFARRGYTFGQDSIEVLYHCILFLTPRINWSTELKELSTEHGTKYPFRQTQVWGSVSQAGVEVNDRKAFSQDNLDRLDQIRARPGHDQGRGNV